MIEQEPFCGVRTHFYHDASSYDMFRYRRVVEMPLPPAVGFRSWLHAGSTYLFVYGVNISPSACAQRGIPPIT